jgi:ethanolamine ammonia-lyase small subunit
MKSLRDFTMARVGLTRAGNGLSTKDVLAFQLAHALARDAVHLPLDFQLDLSLHSAAPDRAAFLRRPDLGRALSLQSRAALAPYAGPFDIVIVVSDGLSALAVHRHARAVLDELLPRLDAAHWSRAPLITVEQGRVAVGDEIGWMVNAAMSLMLIGERPGLSSPDSLGAYLTWQPRPGRTEAQRNCISNIRPEGLGYALAARRIFALLSEARIRNLTGFDLKEEPDKLLSE